MFSNYKMAHTADTLADPCLGQKAPDTLRSQETTGVGNPSSVGALPFGKLVAPVHHTTCICLNTAVSQTKQGVL